MQTKEIYKEKARVRYKANKYDAKKKDYYSKRKEYFVEYRKNNEEKIKQYRKSYNKEYHKKKRFERYGIDEEVFTFLSEKQEHKCKICQNERPLVIDHCHLTGQIRGLLCRQCNSGIGLLQDDLSILERSVLYLKNQIN